MAVGPGRERRGLVLLLSVRGLPCLRLWSPCPGVRHCALGSDFPVPGGLEPLLEKALSFGVSPSTLVNAENVPGFPAS